MYPVGCRHLRGEEAESSQARDSADTSNLAALEGQGGAAPGGFGVSVIRSGAVVSPGNPNATPDLCSSPVNILVPLKETASHALRTGKRTLRLQTTSSAGDKDT